MSRRASNVTPFRKLSSDDAAAAADGRAALHYLGRIVKAIEESRADQERIVPFCRVSDLTGDRGPFSKPTVFRYIKEKKLRAFRLGGVTLIDIDSVNEFLDLKEPWAPPKRDL